MKTINILDEIRNDAITIGNEANLARAIPYLRDGLKPSQRACIYSAYEHGYTSDKPHVKSAKLDGQVTGELWPHGSEYTTIVRLTQPFVMNLPLLDMHGANGSQMGTPDASASRYTEVRLSKACEDGFLKNIKKNTCKWIPNYSEDKEWPELFPAIIPNLFINGSEGMGYCYSQTWLPGNLNEFTAKVKQYIKNKKIDCTDIFPDFPTKGIIINKSDVHNIYETGTGTVILRGKVEINDNIIVITELPYQVYVTPFMEQLRKLVTQDSKGVIKIPGVIDIYNISGDDGIRIEIECEGDPELILNRLYQYSDLQISLSANQYSIIDSIPELVTLEKYIKEYIKYNIETIIAEYNFDLEKANNRLEIVDGLVKALGNIDNIINTIKKSKSSVDACNDLVKDFNFSINQAKAIVDMRLGKLANMEVTELQNEKTSLQKTVNLCNDILGSSKKQEKEFIKRLEAFTDKYGWERRTQLADIDIIKEKAEVKKAAPKIEDCMLILTTNNYIKRVSLVNYKPPKTKNEDEINTIKVGLKDKFILISSSGKMYKLQANKIKECSMKSTGTDLATIINDNIVAIYSGLEEESYLFFITKNGLVKKMNSTDVFDISKNIGTIIMKINDEDSIISIILTNDTEIKLDVAGKTKLLNTAKFNTKGRSAGGQIGIKLKENQIIKVIN